MLEFFKKIIDFFNSYNIEYMLSGSVALSVYTLSRATKDFDFVVNIKEKDVNAFIENFSEGFYCDKDSMHDAIKHSGMFNIIDHATGFKADFFVLKKQIFQETEFRRSQEVDFSGINVYVISAEDLIISKLIWIQEFQSSIQIEDIKTLTKVEGLDLNYIHFGSIN
jgi:hypothetical protein